MKTKIISLSIFFILAISLLTNANADSINFGYNKFVTNPEFHVVKINSKISHNHVINLSENVGVSTNDMSNHKHDDPATTSSVAYKTISLSENIKIDANDFAPKIIATLQENSEKLTTLEKISNTERIRFNGKNIVVDNIPSNELISSDQPPSLLKIEKQFHDPPTVIVQIENNFVVGSNKILPTDLIKEYQLTSQNDLKSFLRTATLIQKNLISFTYDVAHVKNPTMLLLLVPLSGYILIRSEEEKFQINKKRILSFCFIIILVTSSSTTPFLTSANYWGMAYAQESNQTQNNSSTTGSQNTRNVTSQINNVSLSSLNNDYNNTDINITSNSIPHITQDTQANASSNNIPTNSTNTNTASEDQISIQDTLTLNSTAPISQIIPSLGDQISIQDTLTLNSTAPISQIIPSLGDQISIQDTLTLNSTAPISQIIPNATKSWQFTSIQNLTTVGSTKIENKSDITSLKLVGAGYLVSKDNSTRNLSALTLSAWVKPDYSQGSPIFTVISKENQFALSINNIIPPTKTATFSVFDGIKWQTVNSTTPIGKNWTHLAATFNGTTISIYVNGTLQSTLQITGTPIISVNGELTTKTVDQISSNADIVIGAYLNTLRGKTSNQFSGSIENVNLYDSLLNPSQIASLYDNNMLSGKLDSTIELLQNINNSTIDGNLTMSDNVTSMIISANSTTILPTNTTSLKTPLNSTIDGNLTMSSNFTSPKISANSTNSSVLYGQIVILDTVTINSTSDANYTQPGYFVPFGAPFNSTIYDNLTISDNVTSLKILNNTTSLLNTTIPVTPLLQSVKSGYLITEDPEFKFQFFSDQNLKKAGKVVKESLGPITYDKWTEKNTTMTVQIFDPQGKELQIKTKFEKFREGKFDIQLHSKKYGKAGIYKVRLTLVKDNQTFVTESNYAWGLVSLNTNKSIYKLGEIADFTIVVLDSGGHPVCNSNLLMNITDPNSVTTLLTSGNGIAPDSECGLYDAHYAPKSEGNYTVDIQAKAGTINANFNTSFMVQNFFPFDIVRTAQSKIDPVTKPNSFNVRIDIQSFIGQKNLAIKESVPSVLNVVTDADVQTVGDTKILTWNKDLIGNKTSVNYSYSIPMEFPKLYALGPAVITYGQNQTFKEARSWFVAADPNPTKFYLHNTAASPIPTQNDHSTALASGALQNNAGGTSKESLSMTTTIGTSQTSIAAPSTSSTSAQSEYNGRWSSIPLAAQTISAQTWTFQAGFSEQAAKANSFSAFSIYVWRPSTNSTVGFIYDSSTALGSEYGTTEANQAYSLTGSSVTTQKGDILVVEYWIQATQGSPATSYTNTIFYDGTTEGSATSNAAFLSVPLNLGFHYSTNLSETLTPTDAVSKTTSKKLTESVSLTDAVSKGKVITLSESLTLTDAVSKTTSKKLTESVSLTDAVSKTTSKKLTESVSLTDAVSAVAVKSVSLSESLTTSDSVSTAAVKSVSLAESVSLTDAVSAVAVKSVSLAESVSLTDTVSRITSKKLTESVSLTDAVSAVAVKSVSLSESVSLTDAVSAVAVKSVSLSESLTTSDSVSTAAVKSVSLSESVSLTDAVSAVAVKSVSLAESVSLTDAISAVAVKSVSLAESVSLTDAVSAVAVKSVSLAESVSLTDAVSAVAVKSVSLAESVSLTDAVSAVAVKSVSLAESVSLTDAVSAVAVKSVSLSESLTTSDSVSTAAVKSVSLSESLTTSDSVSTAAVKSVSLSESVSLTDAVSAVAVKSVSLSESVSLTDAVSAVAVKSVSLAESVSLTDAVSAVAVKSVSLSESLTTSDSVSTAAVKSVSLSESLTTSDSVSTAAVKSVSLSESVSLTDAVSAVAVKSVSLAESVSLTDAVSAVAVKSVSLSESLTTSDSVSTAAVKSVSLSESLTTSDSVSTAAVKSVSLSESVSLTDAVSAVAVKSVSLAESVSLTDAVSAVAVKSVSLSESLTTSDSVSTAAVKSVSLSESLTTSDAVSTNGFTAVSLSESLTTSDAVSTAGSKSILLLDAITTSDTVSSTTIKSISLSELITLTNAVSASRSKSVLLSEIITPSDVISTSMVKTALLSESITTSDTVSATTIKSISLAELITSTDKLSKDLSSLISEKIITDDVIGQNLAPNQVLIPNILTTVTVDPVKTDLVISSSNASLSTLTVPSTVNTAALNYSKILQNGSTNTVQINKALTITKDTNGDSHPDVMVTIPAGVIVDGPANWRAIVTLPTIVSNTPWPQIPNTIITPDTSIEIGFGSTSLTFSKAVRMTFVGDAGMHVGYFNSVIPFTEITTTCSSDTQIANDGLPAAGNCKINVGSDLVVWTKHFTGFGTFGSSSSSSGSSGGGTSGSGSSGGGGGGGGGAGAVGGGQFGAGFGGTLAPYLKINQVSYDVCDTKMVKIVVVTDNAKDPTVMIRSSISGVIDAQLASEQPYAAQNTNATIRKLVYEAHIDSHEKSFEVLALEAISNNVYSQGKTIEVTGCHETINFVNEQIQGQPTQTDLTAPKIFDVKFKIGNGTKVLSSDVTDQYVDNKPMSVYSIIDSPTPLGRADLRYVTLGQNMDNYAAIKMDVVPLQISNTTYIISSTIPKDMIQSPAIQYWIHVQNQAGKSSDSDQYSIGVKPNYSINGKLELDIVQNRAAGTTARPTAYFTTAGSSIFGTVSLMVDGNTVYTSPPQLFSAGQTAVKLEWKTEPTDQLANHQIHAIANIYGKKFSADADVITFSAVKTVSIMQPIKIGVITDNNGHTVANPQVLYSSFKNDGNKIFKVTAPDGTCVIGGSNDCLVTSSTLGLPGQIKSITVGDQIYRVRYSGPESSLERFSITSVDPILGQWKVEIDSQINLLQQAQAMEDVFLKIKYIPENTRFVSEGN